MASICRVRGAARLSRSDRIKIRAQAVSEESMKRHYFLAICGLMGMLLSLGGTSAQAQKTKPDLEELKKQIELFETVLNQSLTQSFGGPYDTLDKGRGAYLPGYGAVFTFEVSLSPLQSMGPFSPSPTPKSEELQREQENRRRDKAKAVAQQVLTNFGQILHQLAPGESVAVIIHTVAAQPSKVERSTIIISAEKSLIDQRQNNTIDQTEFVRRLRTTEY
jgi:hypothetical protein